MMAGNCYATDVTRENKGAYEIKVASKSDWFCRELLAVLRRPAR